MIQHGLCFQPRKTKESDENLHTLRSVLDGESDQNEQQGNETSKAAAGEAQSKSLSSLANQIHSASKRFTNSINFIHRSRESENKDEVAADGSDVTAPVPTVRKKKPFIKLMRRRTIDDIPTVDVTDWKQQPYSRSSSMSASIESSFRFNNLDEKNLALLLAPVPMDNNPEVLEPEQQPGRKGHFPKLVVPKKFTGKKKPLDSCPPFIENSLSNIEADFSFQAESLPTPRPTAPSTATGLPFESRSTPILERDEEEKAHDGDNAPLPLSVPDSQPVEDRQEKTRVVDEITSGDPTTKEEGEKARDGDGGMLTPSTVPISQPDLVLETKLPVRNVNNNSNASTAEKLDEHGIILEHPHLLEWRQIRRLDRVLNESFGTRPSHEDVRSPVQCEPPETPPALAAVSTIPVRRRKVRFSGFDDGSSAVDAVSKGWQDLRETFLDKLRGTKHHQVRYLRDELMQARAQVAQLELDCEAQRDMKLAFKVHAVRLGAALKKLRDFAQENGLDPRGAGKKRLTPPSAATPNPQTEGSQASHNEHKSKEIGSSPELKLLKSLKAQAKQFGWLCDPNEVELREQIGTGSSANIFKGVWHNLDVAVKCLRPDAFKGNMGAIGAFCQEVQLMSRSRHPYILHMLAACCSPPNQAWVITEYLASGTLTEWLHGTKSRERNRIAPLPPLPERLRIATEISIAMQYLHELSPKVLHRDLKPTNILLDENNHVRIADFNSARCLSSEDAILTGETGTYVYMAPEVMAHEHYDEKCDVYSFAVILCELVTGNPPYVDMYFSPVEIACKVAQGTLRPTLPENQPPALVQLIQSVWKQQPAERPSFSKITTALKVISRNL